MNLVQEKYIQLKQLMSFQSIPYLALKAKYFLNLERSVQTLLSNYNIRHIPLKDNCNFLIHIAFLHYLRSQAIPDSCCCMKIQLSSGNP